MIKYMLEKAYSTYDYYKILNKRINIMAWNMLVKRVKGKEYLIHDFMATTLDKNTFEKMKTINEKTLGEYDFIPQAETDFSWWDKCFKKLTKTKIVMNTAFDIDYYGNVSEIR